MAKICRETVDYIEEQVWEPVEEWVEKRVEKCKKKKCKKWCLCCNKWFCWIETFLEKVITWVARTVINAVTRIVCEIVHDLISLVIDTIVAIVKIVVDVVRILWNVITFDWQGVKDAWKDLLADLVDLGGVIVGWIKFVFRVVLLGYVAGYVREQVEQNELKDYIRNELEKRFKGDSERIATIKEEINLDHGAFGLEFKSTSYRTFVDSLAHPPDGPPYLLTLHQAGTINLRELAGINVGNILDRPRVDAIRLDTGAALDGDDIDDYLSSNGASPHFRIFAVTKGAESEKLNVAEDKFRQLGIKLKWTRRTLEVKGADQMTVDKDQLASFLADPMGRAADGSDVCTLAAAVVFNLLDTSNNRHPFGWTSWFTPNSPISGVTHRDRRPAEFLKYVLAHESGHYFSLEHPGHDGLDKIMFSPVENDWWSASLLFEFLWWSGEPRFTLDDARKAWHFIIYTITGCLPG